MPTKPRTALPVPDQQPSAASFIIGGDSIGSVCGSDEPLLPNPTSGLANTLANRLANRADVRDGSSPGGTGNTGYSNNPGWAWTKWLEILSGNRCKMVRNCAVTGAGVATQLANYQDITSPYYAKNLQQFPLAFWIQEGAGGDDNGVSSTTAVESSLDHIYQLLGNWFPDSLGIAFTQTPINPNDDTFRRPINQWMRDYALKSKIKLFDAERIMMEGLTGFVCSAPTPGTNATPAGPFAAAVNNPMTITVGTPTTFTFNNHCLKPGDPVQFDFYTAAWAAGTPPTGIVQGQIYYVMLAGLTANAFQVSATPGGPSITTSGTVTGLPYVRSHRYMSSDALHQGCSGGYVIAKRLLEIVGERLPDEDNLVNDYAADPQVLAANGGWGTDALMNGTIGAGNAATNWTVIGGTPSVIPREDNYGNWQRVQQAAGQTTPVQGAVYRTAATAFPAGAILQLECEVRWPFGDLVGLTDMSFYIQTNVGTVLAIMLQQAGVVPPKYAYQTPPPGERWVLQHVPIVLPTGITSETYAFSFTAISGTADVGRFSLRRRDL